MVLGVICPAKTSRGFFDNQGKCPIRFPDFVNYYLLKLGGSVKTLDVFPWSTSMRGMCDGWHKGMICQGQDIGNRHKTKLSRNCLGGTILKVEASSLLCSAA